jgi:hypothetical protein
VGDLLQGFLVRLVAFKLIIGEARQVENFDDDTNRAGGIGQKEPAVVAGLPQSVDHLISQRLADNLGTLAVGDRATHPRARRIFDDRIVDAKRFVADIHRCLLVALTVMVKRREAP